MARRRPALGADAVKRETHAPAAAPDGFATYDELPGPDLDAARWGPARLPLPTGDEHIPLDPNAELTVGEGEVRVPIRDGRSRSLDGQGLHARWRRFRVRGVDA